MEELYCIDVKNGCNFVKKEMYPHQKRMYNAIENSNKTLVLKPRQMGITLLLINYVYEKVLNDNTTVAFFSVGRVSKMLLNNFLKIVYLEDKLKIKELNNYSVKFTNGSSVKFSQEIHRLSGEIHYDYDLVIFDNAAFYDFNKPLELFIKPLKVIVASSLGDNEFSGGFYSLIDDCVNNASDYMFLELKWYEHPNYNQKWLNEMVRMLGNEKTDREILCRFNKSDNNKLKNKKGKIYSFRIDEALAKVMEKHMKSFELTKSEYLRFLITNYDNLYF